MRILYISILKGNPWGGPRYSVPKQIEAQKKFDEILWFNLKDKALVEWEKLDYYTDLTDTKSVSISSLAAPFDKPDLVVIEQFYGYWKDFMLLREIRHKGIPYIIVPRGELTESAQKRKRFKKRLFNYLFFEKFAHEAAGIQYLTEQERADSGDWWNNNCFVIPNGTDIPMMYKKSFNNNCFDCVFIGRIEPYQKGLDLLILACRKIREMLIENRFHITIYGPDKEDKASNIRKIIKENMLERIIALENGLYGQEKVDRLLKADVFVLTSRFEGHPMGLIEALSYGLPALVSTGSNMREQIEEYDAGWVTDNTSDSIADGIVSIIRQKHLIMEKGLNARELALNYSWEKIAQKSHDTYTTIINKTK